MHSQGAWAGALDDDTGCKPSQTLFKTFSIVGLFDFCVSMVSTPFDGQCSIGSMLCKQTSAFKALYIVHGDSVILHESQINSHQQACITGVHETKSHTRIDNRYKHRISLQAEVWSQQHQCRTSNSLSKQAKYLPYVMTWSPVVPRAWGSQTLQESLCLCKLPAKTRSFDKCIAACVFVSSIIADNLGATTACPSIRSCS